MSFEDEIAAINEQFFFREFTFSENTFCPAPGAEAQLADSVIWLDELLIVVQLKERNVTGPSTPEQEARWFDGKVVRDGAKQIRDTLSYLNAHQKIALTNHRGHLFHLEPRIITTLHKVISYQARPELPASRYLKKFHRSRTAGVIHLFSAYDYHGLLRTLLTPPEVSEYLSFREQLIDRWESLVEPLPEQALVGQYLRGDTDVPPRIQFIEPLEALDHRLEEWDISGIIRDFKGRAATVDESTDYYKIVAELAKLKRNELRMFKERFELSMRKCRANEYARPYRMASLRTNCGFVFVPLEQDVVEYRQKGLQNYTYACKYDLKLPKCIGVSFVPQEDGWYSIDWCYMEFPWQADAALEELLRENYPFRQVSTKEIERYTYDEEA